MVASCSPCMLFTAVSLQAQSPVVVSWWNLQSSRSKLASRDHLCHLGSILPLLSHRPLPKDCALGIPLAHRLRQAKLPPSGSCLLVCLASGQLHAQQKHDSIAVQAS